MLSLPTPPPHITDISLAAHLTDLSLADRLPSPISDHFLTDPDMTDNSLPPPPSPLPATDYPHPNYPDYQTTTGSPADHPIPTTGSPADHPIPTTGSPADPISTTGSPADPIPTTPPDFQKLYSDPALFINAWLELMEREAQEMRRHRKRSFKKKADGKPKIATLKKKVRCKQQPTESGNTRP